MPDHNIHWTEDDDMLERFVLNRVGAAERNEMEEHLRVCELCQQAVRNEQLLMEGLRRVGREGLKDRLKSRLSRSTRQEIPWPRVISLAALFLIVLGLGVYNGWFGSQQQGQVSLSDETTALPAPATPDQKKSVEESVSKTQGNTRDIARQDAPPPLHKAPDTEYGGKERGAASTDGRSALAGKILREKDAEREKADYSILGAGKEESKPAFRVQQGFAVPPQEAWVAGNVLTPTSEPSAGITASEQDAYEPRESRSMSKRNARRDAAFSRSQIFNGQPVTLSQQPAAALPISQQNGKQQQRIETQMEYSNQTLHLTLYLDSLVDDTALRAAVIQQVSQDSLIVNVANQRIGYRIPTNLNIQTRTK